MNKFDKGINIPLPSRASSKRNTNNKLDKFNPVHERRASFAPFGSTLKSVTKTGDRVIIDRFSPIYGKKLKTKPLSPVSFENVFKNTTKSAI